MLLCKAKQTNKQTNKTSVSHTCKHKYVKEHLQHQSMPWGHFLVFRKLKNWLQIVKKWTKNSKTKSKKRTPAIALIAYFL